METISATDDLAARIIESQLDIGEGPCWDAHRTQAAVIVHRLGDEPTTRWPAFRPLIADLHVAAIYSFPLMIGALRIGAVDLYAETPDALPPGAIAEATELTDHAAAGVLEHVLRHQDDDPNEDGPFSRREVHQATGMVIAQLRVAPSHALLMIRAHAYASGRTVRETAADITARRLTLEP